MPKIKGTPWIARCKIQYYVNYVGSIYSVETGLGVCSVTGGGNFSQVGMNLDKKSH